jgi:hypothetical protein
LLQLPVIPLVKFSRQEFYDGRELGENAVL